MDPAILYILGGLCGLGAICIICTKPCNRLDDEILYGEGWLNKYCNCCVYIPQLFKPRNVVTNIPDSKQMEGRV